MTQKSPETGFRPEIVERKKGEKFWTIHEGKLVCAHVGREGSLKDIRPPQKVELVSEGRSSCLLEAIPPSGVSLNKGLWRVESEEEVITPLEDGIHENVRSICQIKLDVGIVSVVIGESTRKIASILAQESAEKQALYAEKQAQELAEKLRLFGENFENWKQNRLASPLDGLSSRTKGRAQRASGEQEAACAVVEDWLSLESLPGVGEYLFLTKVVQELAGKEKVLSIVRSALDIEKSREEKKVSFGEVENIFKILASFNESYSPVMKLNDQEISRLTQTSDGNIHGISLGNEETTLRFFEKIGLKVLNYKTWKQTQGRIGLVLGGNLQMDRVISAGFETGLLGYMQGKTQRDCVDGLNLSGIDLSTVKLSIVSLRGEEKSEAVALDLQGARPLERFKIHDGLSSGNLFQVLDVSRSKFDTEQIDYCIEKGISEIAKNPACTKEQLDRLFADPKKNIVHLLCAPSATVEQLQSWIETVDMPWGRRFVYQEGLRPEAIQMLQKKVLEKRGFDKNLLASVHVERADLSLDQSALEKVYQISLPVELFDFSLNETKGRGEDLNFVISLENGSLSGYLCSPLALNSNVCFGRVEQIPSFLLERCKAENTKALEEKKRELEILEAKEKILSQYT